MTPERRAVLLLLGLAVGGQGLRLWVGRADTPPGEVRLLDGGPPGAPLAHRDSSLALARPLAPGERIDLDRATAAEIARLPRVGQTLARTIIADRESRGPFGSLEALDRVPGIGPGLLAAISAHAGFSASPGDRATPERADAQAHPAVTLPGGEGGPDQAVGPPSRRAVNLNTATAAELERLPFVGPYMAAQIVAYRGRHGPFPATDSLVKVPGVGPATLAKIREWLTVD